MRRNISRQYRLKWTCVYVRLACLSDCCRPHRAACLDSDDVVCKKLEEITTSAAYERLCYVGCVSRVLYTFVSPEFVLNFQSR